MNENPETKLVDFTFGRPWQHATKDYKAGDVIKVTPAIREKLLGLKAGTPIEEPKPAAAPATPAKPGARD